MKKRHQTVGIFPTPVIDEDPAKKVLESVKSQFQRIEIAQHPVYGDQLWIDGDLQISVSDHAYNVAMISPLLSHGNLEYVCILGGGDGGVLYELLLSAERNGLPLKKATLVDIDGQVVDLSKKYLSDFCGNAFEHHNTEIIIGDAFAYLHRANRLDAIIYDLTMDPIREESDRRKYIGDVIKAISDSLNAGGMLSMQVCGEKEHDPMLSMPRTEYIEILTAEVMKHFAGYVLQNVFIPSFEEAWTFLTAQKPS